MSCCGTAADWFRQNGGNLALSLVRYHAQVVDIISLLDFSGSCLDRIFKVMIAHTCSCVSVNERLVRRVTATTLAYARLHEFSSVHDTTSTYNFHCIRRSSWRHQSANVPPIFSLSLFLSLSLSLSFSANFFDVSEKSEYLVSSKGNRIDLQIWFPSKNICFFFSYRY